MHRAGRQSVIRYAAARLFARAADPQLRALASSIRSPFPSAPLSLSFSHYRGIIIESANMARYARTSTPSSSRFSSARGLNAPIDAYNAGVQLLIERR